MFSPPLNASTCNHLLIAPSLLFSLPSVQCVCIYSSCVFATVSAQQSFVSSHRLFIMQLCKDDPGTLLLTQSHPGNWLTEMHQHAFLILRGKKLILNLVSEFDQTCVNGATSHLVMSFKNSQELAEIWNKERSNSDQPHQAHSVVLLTRDAVHINTCPAILANYTEGPSKGQHFECRSYIPDISVYIWQIQSDGVTHGVVFVTDRSKQGISF